MLLIPAALALVVTGMFFLFRELSARHHGRLTEYSYSYGGDMRGSYRALCIRKMDGGWALITASEKEWHYQDLNTTEYRVPVSVLEEMEALYDARRLYRFPFYPENKMVILDAGVGSYDISFDGNVRSDVRFSSRTLAPASMWAHLREFEAILADAMQNGERLPGLVRDPSLDENPDAYAVQEGVCAVRVSGVCVGRLTYRIANGGTEPLCAEGTEVLYRIGADGTREPVFRNNYAVSRKISAGYSSEYEVSLTEEPLPAGDYLLEVGGMEAAFTLQ